ncbi:hypothetical protein CHUAL_007709 [Chamberlinius hualienensis]
MITKKKLMCLWILATLFLNGIDAMSNKNSTKSTKNLTTTKIPSRLSKKHVTAANAAATSSSGSQSLWMPISPARIFKNRASAVKSLTSNKGQDVLVASSSGQMASVYSNNNVNTVRQRYGQSFQGPNREFEYGQRSMFNEQYVAPFVNTEQIVGVSYSLGQLIDDKVQSIGKIFSGEQSKIPMAGNYVGRRQLSHSMGYQNAMPAVQSLTSGYSLRPSIGGYSGGSSADIYLSGPSTNILPNRLETDRYSANQLKGGFSAGMSLSGDHSVGQSASGYSGGQSAGGYYAGQSSGAYIPGPSTGGYSDGASSLGYSSGQLVGGYSGGQSFGGHSGGQLSGGFTAGQSFGGQSGGYSSGQSSVGYGADQSSGGQSSGGYSSGQSAGGQSSDGYSAGQSSGGYSTGQSSGGYSSGPSPSTHSGSQSSGDYSSSQLSGGHSTGQSFGGHSDGEVSGGYSGGQSSGGYSSGQSSGGNAAGQSSDGYSSGQSSGAQSSDGYSSGQSSGGYTVGQSSGVQPTGGYAVGQSFAGQPSGDYSSGQSSGDYSAGQSSGGYSSGPSPSTHSGSQSSGDYSSSQLSGGHSTGQSFGGHLGGGVSGGYSGGQSSGDYSGGQSSGGPSSAGYSTGPSSGSYSAGQSSGGHSDGQSSGGYSGGQTSGDYFGEQSGSQSSGGHSDGQSSGGHSDGQSSSGYSGNQPSVGYSASQSSGSYSVGQSSGGHSSGQSPGGYSASQSSGSYSASQSSGERAGGQSSGGYSSGRSLGGYTDSQSSGGNFAGKSSGGHSSGQSSGGYSSGPSPGGYSVSQSSDGYSAGTSKGSFSRESSVGPSFSSSTSGYSNSESHRNNFGGSVHNVPLSGDYTNKQVTASFSTQTASPLSGAYSEPQSISHASNKPSYEGNVAVKNTVGGPSGTGYLAGQSNEGHNRKQVTNDYSGKEPMDYSGRSSSSYPVTQSNERNFDKHSSGSQSTTHLVRPPINEQINYEKLNIDESYNQKQPNTNDFKQPQIYPMKNDYSGGESIKSSISNKQLLKENNRPMINEQFHYSNEKSNDNSNQGQLNAEYSERQSIQSHSEAPIAYKQQQLPLNRDFSFEPKVQIENRPIITSQNFHGNEMKPENLVYIMPNNNNGFHHEDTLNINTVGHNLGPQTSYSNFQTHFAPDISDGHRISINSIGHTGYVDEENSNNQFGLLQAGFTSNFNQFANGNSLYRGNLADSNSDEYGRLVSPRISFTGTKPFQHMKMSNGYTAFRPGTLYTRLFPTKVNNKLN